MGEAKTALMVVLLLGVVVFVLRSAKRAPQRLPLPIGPELTLGPAARGLAPAAAHGDARLPERYAPMTKSQAEIAAADMSRQLNSAQPEEVATLLRDWMTERTNA